MREGAVAFLDALGFKGIWKRHSSEEVLQKLAALEQFVIQSSQQTQDRFTDASTALRLDPLEVRTLVVSDSIFITAGRAGIRDEDFGTTMSQAVYICAMLSGFVCLEGSVRPPHMVYRGCIAAGEFEVSSDSAFLVGSAVDEAASNEPLADVGLVWLAPSAQQHARRENARLRRTLIPLKSGREYETLAVNPPGLLPDTDENRLNFLNGLATAFSEGEGQLSVEVLRQNTQRFYKEAEPELWEAFQAHAAPGPIDPESPEGRRVLERAVLFELVRGRREMSADDVSSILPLFGVDHIRLALTRLVRAKKAVGRKRGRARRYVATDESIRALAKKAGSR